MADNDISTMISSQREATHIAQQIADADHDPAPGVVAQMLPADEVADLFDSTTDGEGMQLLTVVASLAQDWGVEETRTVLEELHAASQEPVGFTPDDVVTAVEARKGRMSYLQGDRNSKYQRLFARFESDGDLAEASDEARGAALLALRDEVSPPTWDKTLEAAQEHDIPVNRYMAAADGPADDWRPPSQRD